MIKISTSWRNAFDKLNVPIYTQRHYFPSEISQTQVDIIEAYFKYLLTFVYMCTSWDIRCQQGLVYADYLQPTGKALMEYQLISIF